MYRNLNNCPEIEELKKAILVDLPDDLMNSNSNSKDKLSVIHKKEKDVAFDFLRKFNEAHEKNALQKKQKELELEEKLRLEQEKEKEKKRLEQEKEIKKKEQVIIIERKEIEKKQIKTEEGFKRPTEKFNRLANLNDLEDFNNSVINSNRFKLERNNKKRKMNNKFALKPVKQIKEEIKIGNEMSSQIPKKEMNKIRIEFKNLEKNLQTNIKEEEITIKNKPLQIYSNEEKICEETENFSFVGKVVACSRVDEIWFIDIEKFDKNTNSKLCFKAIYNLNLSSNFPSAKELMIKDIKSGNEYIFEFKSGPKEFHFSYIMFL